MLPYDKKKLAQGYLQTGDFEAAKRLLGELCHRLKDDADSCIWLGVIHGQEGRIDEAIKCFNKALTIRANSAEALYNLGNAYLHKGDFVKAATIYRKFVCLQPLNPAGLVNLAYALFNIGDLNHAALLYQQLARLEPKNPEHLVRLASVLAKLEQWHEVESCYKRVLQIEPDNVDALFNLGTFLQKQSRLHESTACYEKIIKLDPSHHWAMARLGSLLAQQGFSETAPLWLDKAVLAKPDAVDIYITVGITWRELGNLEKARAVLQDALELQPDHIQAQRQLGGLLLASGRQSEARKYYLDCLQKNKNSVVLYSGLAWVLNFSSSDPREISNTHKLWAKNYQKAIPLRRHHANLRDAKRRLRIGYISPDFRAHSVAFFIKPLLENHSRKDVEIYCYSDVLNKDSITRSIRKLSDNWIDISNTNDEAVADLIQKDQIDILVDLAGHTTRNRLGVFARKPAPVQVAYLGYPTTTGLKAIDYRLTDNSTDPPDSNTDTMYSEKLLRLPGGFLCYQAPPGTPGVSGLPACSVGFVTFGSFNNLAKTTPRVLDLWSQILGQIPDSRLILKNQSLKDKSTKQNLFDFFASKGIEAERIQLVDWALTLQDHLDWYTSVDISLDTFPYNGTTTTCESLWMGVPVITLSGQLHAGRVGVSILQQLGMDDWIAQDVDAYVTIARHWSTELDALAGLRYGLRHKLMKSALCDGNKFAREIEGAYRSIWKTWCQSR